MNNGRTVQLPEMYTRRKLNSLYREIPLKDPVFRLLRKYANAAADNLLQNKGRQSIRADGLLHKIPIKRCLKYD